MSTKYFKINPADNVSVAIHDLKEGEVVNVDGVSITLKQDITAGHKIALVALAVNDNIVKYGYPIGHAITAIPQGGLVNETNIKTNLEGLLDYEYKPTKVELNIPNRNLTFNGYKRKSGETGIRNEMWIVPTVGCVNGVADSIIAAFKEEVGQLEGVDSLEVFKHNYGCSQLGGDHETTRKILKDIVLHPNAGGVLVLGLGCENNQPDVFREYLGEFDESRVKFLVTQKVKDEIAEGVAILKELYATAKKDTRVATPLSELRVGLKCGGSDGFSGITANPLLGVFSDFLVAQGGTTVLTEVPEMFGAETILMNRCETIEMFDKTVHLINDFKEYFMKNDQPVYENPSPGNKAGGISTLEEKSLGCTQKCGKSYVKDVNMYGDRLKTKGLNLLSAPGNDLVAATALGASGCQMVLFTTGRGTPFGSFVPTMKISTNTPLFENKPGWIDFNAGVLLQGKKMEDLLEDFIAYIITVANGEWVNHEKRNSREIAIFKTGVTL
ncbi:MAG: altronate dehydratase family protein [Paludibacteraceae bacterium]|nr:altronate dehydratase family protein [Paludibacteraceae bacterium]